MMTNLRYTHQRGVGLIEVLIAVLVFSLGLIGIAGLLVMATKANHGAYLRTQVTYLAQNMADRMSANPIGVWTNAYNSAVYPLSVSQSCNAGCTPAQLALHDQGMWSDQLQVFLPNPQASITCNAANAGFAPPLAMRPPYGGTCVMTISWDDRGVGGESNLDTAQQTFAWEFQP